MIYLVQWKIDGVDSEEYEVTFPDAAKDPDFKGHAMNIIEHCGQKPIPLSEGQKIILKMKLSSNYSDENEAHTKYGDGGDKAQYSTIADQDYDWDMERSDEDRNGTGAYRGQFPFIIYQTA